MFGRPFSNMPRGAVLLLFLCIAAAALSRANPASFDLHFGDGTASIAMESSFLRVAFEIGQECSETNTARLLRG
jgi:hypothetical protein